MPGETALQITHVHGAVRRTECRCTFGAAVLSEHVATLFHLLFTPPQVRPSDLDRFNIPQQCRLPMTDEDLKTGRKLVRGT